MADCSQDNVGDRPQTKVPDSRSKTDAIRVLFVEDDELYREALADGCRVMALRSRVSPMPRPW
jgi:hypothetical protein